MIQVPALCLLLIFFVSACDAKNGEKRSQRKENRNSYKNWLVNYPEHFQSKYDIDMINSTNIEPYVEFVNYYLSRPAGASAELENVDAIEHFFWGKENGLSIELGAADGSDLGKSITISLETRFGWNRILVEGDILYRERLLKNAPKAFIANTPVCKVHQQLHYVGNSSFVGGILEHMNDNFISFFHPEIFKATTGEPKGNVSTITDWSPFPQVHLVDCIPLRTILRKAKVKHVNFFMLDVEGAEYEVLQSIDWKRVTFDVICIESSPGRRFPGFVKTVTAYLKERGFEDVSGLQGRNIWFKRVDFVPSVRPGLDPKCFNGVVSMVNNKRCAPLSAQ